MGWIRDNFTLVANIALQAALGPAGSLAISVIRGAAAGFVGGLASTGSLQGALQGAFWGGVGAGVAGFVGHGGAFGYAWGESSPFGTLRWLAHGVSQGLVGQLRGGSFRSGFVGSVAGGLSPAGDMLAHGVGSVVSRTVIAAVFGGLAAEASGGSFSDGALSAAMVHLYNDEGLPMLPQGLVDVAAGFGDTISLGITDIIRDLMDTNGAVNKYSDAYGAGEWAGVGYGIAAGGAIGWRMAGERAAGKEFSHWIPNRWGGVRSKWNGNYVSRDIHALSDPYRYRFMPRTWKAQNPMPNQAWQQWTRFPYVYKGAVGGGVYGSIGAEVARD